MKLFSWFKRSVGSPDDPKHPLPIIIVSGLPRSGTSLMMQMLHAGGIEVATDGIRTPDDDNPRGYYELERIKRLHQDASWLVECRGKAVKVISFLLPVLPAEHEYRIIFVERNLSEILASQKKMMQRRGTQDLADDDEELAASFERHLRSAKQGLANRSHTRTLYVSYHEVLEFPHRVASRICEFLQLDLDTAAMTGAVDAQLYRRRSLNAGDLRT